MGKIVGCAYFVASDETFAVVLSDALIDGAESDLGRDYLAAMIGRGIAFRMTGQ